MPKFNKAKSDGEDVSRIASCLASGESLDQEDQRARRAQPYTTASVRIAPGLPRAPPSKPTRKTLPISCLTCSVPGAPERTKFRGHNSCTPRVRKVSNPKKLAK